jgi:nicotinate-nucleotide--dimethylbenzimidazole phosphoribosyltransferase
MQDYGAMMTDLTDSYCERCGARYVFSPPAPKTMSLKGARVLAKGFKNFVMNDGQSMADSLALARHEDSHLDSTRITEAFHRTFNFCMTCRQYACEKCWNVRAGACYTCSPEEGFEPVAREDHLLVRTPVARWDMDWSIFPNGPDAEALNRPAPLPFDPPIEFSDSLPAMTAESTAPAETAALPQNAAPAEDAPPAESPAPAAWPVADVLTPDPAGLNGRGDPPGHRTPVRPVDPMAASLWPMADQLSPEMTLTPEELQLVETGLSHGDGHDQVSAEAAELTAMAAEQEHQAEVPIEPAPAAFASEPATEPEPAAAFTPALGPTPAPAPAPTPDHSDEEPRFYRVAPPAQVWPVETATAPAAGTPNGPTWPAAPNTQPQWAGAPVAPVPPQPQQPPTPSSWTSGGQSQVNATPWPRATAWSERPVEPRHEASPDSPAPAAGQLPAATPEMPINQEAPAEQTAATYPASPSVAPVPQGLRLPAADARSAAAMRMSAVPMDEAGPLPSVQPAPDTQPAAQAPVPTDDSAPAIPAPQFAAPAAADTAPAAADTAPAAAAPAQSQSQSPAPDNASPWLSAVDGPRQKSQSPSQHQMFDMPVSQPVRPQVPAAPQAPAPQVPAPQVAAPQVPAAPQVVAPQAAPEPAAHRTPAAPWQPLGSAWPAGQDPRTPWPGPQVPDALPAVAAQQNNASTVTAMWAQSSQEVLNRGTVRVCHRCALPVSTHARFCRRCGTQQT